MNKKVTVIDTGSGNLLSIKRVQIMATVQDIIVSNESDYGIEIIDIRIGDEPGILNDKCDDITLKSCPSKWESIDILAKLESCIKDGVNNSSIRISRS